MAPHDCQAPTHRPGARPCVRDEGKDRQITAGRVSGMAIMAGHGGGGCTKKSRKIEVAKSRRKRAHDVEGDKVGGKSSNGSFWIDR